MHIGNLTTQQGASMKINIWNGRLQLLHEHAHFFYDPINFLKI